MFPKIKKKKLDFNFLWELLLIKNDGVLNFALIIFKLAISKLAISKFSN
jgi:hypothetical protein